MSGHLVIIILVIMSYGGRLVWFPNPLAAGSQSQMGTLSRAGKSFMGVRIRSIGHPPPVWAACPTVCEYAGLQVACFQLVFVQA